MDLSVDQIRIINSKTAGQSLIKGVAGSGKTTVALFKLAALQQQALLNKNVLVVTYNKTLIRYMTYLCNSYRISIDKKKVKIKTIDSIIFSELQHLNKTRKIASNADRRNCMKKAIQTVSAQYPKNTLLNAKNLSFLMEEVDWIKHCLYLQREHYLHIDRLGRNSIGENRFRLSKDSEDRNAIFDLFITYETILKNSGLTDFSTNAVRLYQKIKKGELIPQQYDFIIVDESQDLSRVQLEIIRSIYKNTPDSTIIFIADVAQSIYTNSWLSKQSFRSVGFDMSGKSNILSKNYRTTRQIAQAAYSLLQHDRELQSSRDYVEPQMIERNGALPRYRHFDTLEEEFSYIAEEIKKCSNCFELRDIAVVLRNNAALKELRIYLTRHGVDAVLFKELEGDEQQIFGSDKVKLYTLHAIKGLEASVVFIAGISEGIFPVSMDALDAERKLLYVGMTRAKERLYLTSSEKPSSFILEIAPEYLQLSDETLDTDMDIAITDYQPSPRIQKKSGMEEQIRQWYLEQLKLHYGYPQQLLEPEAAVQCGSHTFYVDIAVYQDEAHEIPWIYVETKAEGENLHQALLQVKSYIVPGNAPEYLVITNKAAQLLLHYKNGSYTECKRLPFYHETLRHAICFYDFLHNRTLSWTQDALNPSVFYQDASGAVQIPTVSIPMKGTAAAGGLKYANEEYGNNCTLPADMLADTSSRFLLNVEGDSMIDFNIQNGDKILVRKQAFAPEGSIVIAGSKLTNEATVKQVRYQNADQVILHPGNKTYPDISLNAEDFFMNGIVIGSIRGLL